MRATNSGRIGYCWYRTLFSLTLPHMRLSALTLGFSVALAAPLAAQHAAPALVATPSPLVTDASSAIPTATSVVAANTDASTTPVVDSPNAGPTADAARAGIAPRETKSLAVNKAATDRHVGAGQNVALMVVGGAALITGLIIGGDGGTLVAIGGAVVGLYGLYNFVK